MTADERRDMVHDLNHLSNALKQASRTAELIANRLLTMSVQKDDTVSAPPS
jgi:hypothetical protein